MTKKWSKVLCFLLLSGCASSAGDRHSSDSRTDAGGSTNPQPNQLSDGAVSEEEAGHAAANGGSGGQASSEGGHAAPVEQAGTGGAAQNTGGDDRPPPPVTEAGGHGGAAAAGTSGKSDDTDAGAPARDPNAICTTCGACEETVPVVSAMHTTMPVNYPDPPPSSGPHNPCWATWGIHDEPLAPERWVHNLEHGGVVYLYNCPDGCDAEIATIKDISTKHNRTVVAAYDKLPKRFAAVSWGHRLVSDCLDEKAFTAFYTAHYDRGPESNSMGPNPSCPP